MTGENAHHCHKGNMVPDPESFKVVAAWQVDLCQSCCSGVTRLCYQCTHNDAIRAIFPDNENNHEKIEMTRARKTGGSSAASYRELSEFALDLARKSGDLVLRYYRRPIEVENKGKTGSAKDFDPVTAADRAVEELIRGEVGRRYPDHGIIGEEFGNTRPEADFQWIIDPIDGTRSFIMGLPTWGTLIGLSHKGEPYLGVMSQPFTRELYWSTESGSHWSGPLGEGELKVRPCARLSDAVLASTHPSLFKTKAELDRFVEVETRVKLARFGGDCYAYSLLAAGLVDIVVEASLQTFDVAALIPIIERAGGVITTWDGGPAIGGGRIIAAGDRRVHAEALPLLVV